MREDSVDVVSEIDVSPVRSIQLLVVFLCGLTYALDGFDTLSISFVAPTLAEQWSVPSADFGPVFAAGLFGLLVGALTIGPLADRFGRKSLIVISTVIFGLFSLAAAFTTSLFELGIVRFLTGIGLGGAMPNLIALTVEYMPKRSRAVLVTAMSCGFAAGGMIGGAASSVIIPLWGWQSVFLVGGALPLLLVPILMSFLPESLPFLARKGGRSAVISGLLTRISGRVYGAAQDFTAPGQNTGSNGLARLFQDGRAALTAMLWLMFFMNFLVTFMMFNWAPVLVRDSGASLSLALAASILMNLGTLCGVGPAYVADRVGASTTVGVNFSLAAAFLLLLAGVQGHIWFTLTLCFLVGVTNMGSTFIANVIAATVYPVEIRSTGLGWALGIGRLGSIMGPLIGGYLLGAGWAATSLFVVAAAAATFAALAGLGLALAQKGRSGSNVVGPITVN